MMYSLPFKNIDVKRVKIIEADKSSSASTIHL